MPFALNAERERELTEILTRYPTKMAACIPALHLCQDQNGWIDEDIVTFVAHRLDLPPAHVKGVVTFYTLFNQKPVGKHQLWVCRTLPCALRGAGEVLAHCEKRLGIHAGETTPDGKVTLRTAECLASCGTAPMIQVDREYYENLTPERLDEILDSLVKGGAIPAPGAPAPIAPPPSSSPLGSAGPFGGEEVKRTPSTSPAAGSVLPPPSTAPRAPSTSKPPPPKPGSLPPAKPPPAPKAKPSSRPPPPPSAPPPNAEKAEKSDTDQKTPGDDDAGKKGEG